MVLTSVTNFLEGRSQKWDLTLFSPYYLLWHQASELGLMTVVSLLQFRACHLPRMVHIALVL